MGKLPPQPTTAHPSPLAHPPRPSAAAAAPPHISLKGGSVFGARGLRVPQGSFDIRCACAVRGIQSAWRALWSQEQQRAAVRPPGVRQVRGVPIEIRGGSAAQVGREMLPLARAAQRRPRQCVRPTTQPPHSHPPILGGIMPRAWRILASSLGSRCVI